jgi:hypothetical protein
MTDGFAYVKARYEHGSDVLESYKREQLDAVP